MNSQLLAAIVGAISGAAVSVAWQLWVTGKREKTALSLKFVTDYLNLADELAAVYGLLTKPEQLQGETPTANKNYNRVTSVGNWFDTMAMCYVRNHLNRQLIMDSGIRESTRRFSQCVARSLPELTPSDERWVNMRDMCNMHHHD